MATNSTSLKLPRRRLARIRCVQQCIECFRNNRPLPESLCYISSELEYQTLKNAKVTVFSGPNKNSKKVADLVCSAGAKLYVSGEELCNSQGQWAKVHKICMLKSNDDAKKIFTEDAWVLLYSSQSTVEESPTYIPASISQDQRARLVHSWEDVVENHYSLHLGKKAAVVSTDQEAKERLQHMPPNWTIDHDDDLAQFLGAHIEIDDNLGSIKNYVESINVSSYCEDDGPENMTDNDPDTYWESDGSQGLHWIRLKMKKGTIVKKLFITVDPADDNYLPYRILVMGGDMDNLKKLNECSIDMQVYNQSQWGTHDICVLQDQTEHHPIIEIRIKECKDDGIDTRIHQIKIKSTKERDLGLSKDHFSPQNMVRYPKLECFDPEILYRRALLLQRFVSLLDSVLPFIVPDWEYSTGSYSSLEIVRQLLPLSKKRMSLIDTFLRESETCRPAHMVRLYINRRAAAEHKSDPTLDPECKNTVFNQIIEGLKPRDSAEKPLDYRWPSKYDQWWECKFISEGIIDQGGGFRDSLSDLADELCPSDSDCPVPLPFFIRSPNQNHMDSNVNRDVYIPNSSCKEFHKYEWIGKLMGACLRGKENLVLSLPPFVWKKMAGERITWSRDYVTVDESEVKMIENMEFMDREEFAAYFGEERTWTTVLSDGTLVPLKLNGTELTVSYDERMEYSKLVQETRMNECNEQLDAVRQGLLQVVPGAVLTLLTWQELERRVCGDPEITLEALRRTTHYEDLEESDTRVKHLWEALGNFSNEDRSRFLRFVTGRRRLPAPLYICPDKEENIDALPESSTCSNTLYLPHYSSAKMAEEKLRYAAYNCIAIDTDMSPWDE